MQDFLVPFLVKQGFLNKGLSRFIQCWVAVTVATFITISSLLSLGQIAIAQANSSDVSTILRLVPKINSPLAAQCDYQTRILSDNPIAYWRLGETSGVIATNMGSLGSAVDGSYEGSVTLGQSGLISGESDTAVRFDGIDDEINIPDHDAINTGKLYNARTIELWFKADTVSDRQVLYEEGGENRGLNIYIEGGNLYVNGWNLPVNGAGTTTPWGQSFVSSSISANTTYYTALVFKADTTGPTATLTGTITGYLNGASFGSVSGIGQLYGHGDDVGIGAVNQRSFYHDGTHGPTPYHFTGIIDEVAIYDYPLTTSQIQNHHLPCISPIYLPIIVVNS